MPIAEICLFSAMSDPLAVMIRRANLPTERPRIDEIHHACFEATHRTLLGASATPWFEPCGTCFVALKKISIKHDYGSAVCGFIYVVPNKVAINPDQSCGEEEPLPRVDDLFVHPSAQGEGIGSLLLKHAEAFVAKQSSDVLNLCVLEVDVRARNFYHRHGFVEGSRFVCEVDKATYVHAAKQLAGFAAGSQQPAAKRKRGVDDALDWSRLSSSASADLVWSRVAKAGARFRSVAYSQDDGAARAYDGVCSLHIGRILSRRRHHREAVGSITCINHGQDSSIYGMGSVAKLAPLVRFAAGKFRLERVKGDAPTQCGEVIGRPGSPEHCELHFEDDTAFILNQGEGLLEEDELRLLARVVCRKQHLVLSDGVSEVVVEEGDLVLENAFRPKDGRKGACLFRQEGDGP